MFFYSFNFTFHWYLFKWFHHLEAWFRTRTLESHLQAWKRGDWNIPNDLYSFFYIQYTSELFWGPANFGLIKNWGGGGGSEICCIWIHCFKSALFAFLYSSYIFERISGLKFTFRPWLMETGLQKTSLGPGWVTALYLIHSYCVFFSCKYACVSSLFVL